MIRHRNMKKTYILILLTGIFSSACDFIELEENPPSVLSPGTFYRTESEFQAALTGAFHPLYSGWEGFDYAYPLILSSGAEDVRSDAGIFRDMDRLTPNANDQSVEGVWKRFYQSIANANTIIGNLGNAQDIPEKRLGEIEGQAKFIRAFCFFFLTQWFGEVQLTTFKNQSSVETLVQSPVADIYAAIVSDLKAAETLLPLKFGQKGRPTKGAAKALLAKVYLTMAGWPLEETGNYALARDKAAELISGELAGTYRLENNFADLWKQKNKLTNSEFIFAFYGTTAAGGTASHLHTASRHWGNGEGGWGDSHSEARFFNAFPAGPRKEASFTAVFADGTSWQEAGVQPYIAKYREAGETNGNDGEGFNVMLRYADVLLIYAEAANQAEGSPSAAAREAINQVRRRAAGRNPLTPNAEVDLPAATSQAAFDKAVLEERNWELAFECNRWFDLVRKKMVVSVNKPRHPHVSENNRLLPKPAAQLIKGVLTQNPGY